MAALLSPSYLPESVDDHAFSTTPAPRAPAPLGVLLINLGTPDTPTAPDIRRYLREFLSDPRVIELPALLWQPILRGLVLARRPAKLVPRYADIWMEEGSPLLVWSEAQAQALQQRLDARALPVRVAVGMRYGNPSIADGLAQLQAARCEHVLLVPLYPQYSATTTATAVDHACRALARRRNQPAVRSIKRFHTHPGYIAALASQVQELWQEKGLPDRLLLSFHGLPWRMVERGDPYHRDCMETARLLADRLGEAGALVHVSFQSRFGAQAWLQPYTEPTLRQWAREGVRRVDVICPGFVSDCLETLEEIQIECRDAFVEEGGETLNYIPCLNAREDWIAVLEDLVVRELQGWPGIPADA